jgi:DNA-directed RNA polymerase specialized sigma24 family protein
MQWTLTRESFDALLVWLHADREQAAKRYEEIRSALIKNFRSHGCPVPEDLADETINRVARKAPELIGTYVGDPVRYFYRVAHYVHLENLRSRREIAPLPDDVPMLAREDDVEPEYSCLEECMKQFKPRSRELVSQYYRGEKGIKIEARKQLALRLGIKLTALRLQAHRIRAGLKKCIEDCLSQKAA